MKYAWIERNRRERGSNNGPRRGLSNDALLAHIPRRARRKQGRIRLAKGLEGAARARVGKQRAQAHAVARHQGQGQAQVQGHDRQQPRPATSARCSTNGLGSLPRKEGEPHNDLGYGLRKSRASSVIKLIALSACYIRADSTPNATPCASLHSTAVRLLAELVQPL